jgi:integrase
MVLQAGDRKARTPQLTHHKATGRARVRFNGRDYYCGKWGSREAQRRYEWLIAQWKQSGGRPPQATGSQTIVELIAAYLAHAKQHYRRADGAKGTEYDRVVRELRPLRRLCGYEEASNFGAPALKAYRQWLLEGNVGAKSPIRWSRTTINHAIGTVRRMFRFGGENELVDPSLYARLKLVADLRAGQCEAAEPREVLPVAPEYVGAIEPFVSPTIWAMIRLQQLTGARPGEICALTAGDIDTAGDVWVATLRQHKTAHRGRRRTILIGPQARAVIKPFLKPDLAAPLFSPAAAEARRRAERHAHRRTPLHLGNRPGTSRKTKPKRRPGQRYTTDSYREAIARACDKAFPPAGALARAEGESERAWLARLTPEQKQLLASWRRAHRWHPHQLRHSFATQVRRECDVEMAAVLLGHSSAALTDAVYAQRDLARARALVAKIG